MERRPRHGEKKTGNRKTDTLSSKRDDIARQKKKIKERTVHLILLFRGLGGVGVPEGGRLSGQEGSDHGR